MKNLENMDSYVHHIAPGEGIKPILMDPHCVEMTFPHFLDMKGLVYQCQEKSH